MGDGGDIVISHHGTGAVGAGSFGAGAVGAVIVGTEAMEAAAHSLGRIENELSLELRELAALALASAHSDRPAEHRSMDSARASLLRARGSASSLVTALHRAAGSYGAVERASNTTIESLTSRMAYLTGFILTPVVLSALPLILGAGRVIHTIGELDPESTHALSFGLLRDWLHEHRQFLSDPRFAEFVRLTVMSLDDFGAGVVHLPFVVQRMFDESGVGGVSLSVATMVGISAATGYLQETPVRTVVASRTTTPSAVPTGWRDRASRIPDSDGSAQVRIDTYRMTDGSKRYEVYIGGTRDFALGNDDQPWDMTSNLNAMDGSESGSMRSVQNAMKDAGITSDSPVLFTGHSQGGLVAARLAGSGDYNVKGLFTLGAPAAQIVVPNAVPWIAVEHTNDIVPALSGNWTSSDPVLVTRTLDEKSLSADPKFFPAHELPQYEGTAELIDESDDSRVEAVTRQFDDFTRGATPSITETFSSQRIIYGR
jgi:hypothetical protein